MVQVTDRRDPFIWLNYPVNDYGQHNLLMGPSTATKPTSTTR